MLKIEPPFNSSPLILVIKELRHKVDYLYNEHILRHFREELLMTKLLSRERRAVWEEGGKEGVLERAEDRVQSLLKISPPEQLSGSQLEKLKEIERHWLNL